MTRLPTGLALGLLLCTFASPLSAGDVLIVDNAKPRVALFVPARLLDDANAKPEPPAVWTSLRPEDNRRRLRESIKDFAAILGRSSGAKIDIVAGKLAANEKRLTILVGELAVEHFGKTAKSYPYGQGFRIVVTPKAIGLAGESDLATSYALYALLDQIGCRWYMPGPLGEVLPNKKTVAVREQDLSTGPYTIYRGIWYCDNAFARRNRLGGMALAAGHALEYTVPKELRKSHPEIRAMIAGKPHDHLVKWTHPLVARAIRDSIVDSLKKDPTQNTFSLSPDDGASWDESDDAKHDAGDFDPAAGAVSKTDRLMVLVNRVASAVAPKYPNVRLGVLAYADYIRPPVREKVPANVVPPLRQWRWHTDKQKTDESNGWAKADFNDTAWRTTDCTVDTWSALGLHYYMGSLWYRTRVKRPTISAGRRIYLWAGATDGRIKVYVNGKHVPYVSDKGTKSDSFTGYGQPVSFDVTSGVKPGADNQISLFCTRENLNELGTGGLIAPVVLYADKQPAPGWLQATAHLVPKETAPEGAGYFAIIEGHNQRLYIGTHANAVNSWLIEFDPEFRRMRVVVDAHKAIGVKKKGFASQAKIHSRNNVGASGKIYFGTKQGYPDKDESWVVYPGGYPMACDPKTGTTEVFPIPVPHQGINSITPDESRGVAYVSTCSDHKPGPGENAIFLKLDLKTKRYKRLMDTRHIYGFIVIDWQGRAYHPILGGDIARYDPKTDKVERLKQTIDGKAPAATSHLADAEGHPINWDVSSDGKTLYSLPMSANHLYAYDLTAKGDTLPGRDLGALLPKARVTDCRAMCVSPSGTVWAAITELIDGVYLPHLVSYRPGEKRPVDRGRVAVRNPDYTTFTDATGKPLPFHGGLFKRSDGITTSRYVVLGVCEGKDGSVYALMLHPYTVLQVGPEQLK